MDSGEDINGTDADKNSWPRAMGLVLTAVFTGALLAGIVAAFAHRNATTASQVDAGEESR